MTPSPVLASSADDTRRLAECIARSRRKRFAPQPRLTPSQWIEKHRYLSRENSASPGRYSFDRYPLLRKIADDYGDTSIRQVVVLKPAQVGYTELTLGLLAFSVVADPCPMLMVHETIDHAKRFTKKRIKTMIRDTPALHAVVGETSGRRESDDTLTFLGYPGGSLTHTGSNTAGGVSSDPIRRVWVEELSRWKANGSGQGNTLKLADKRMTTFWNSQLFVGSSPSFEGPVEQGGCQTTALYEQTNRQRWFVPCKECGGEFALMWRDAAGEYMLRCDKRDDGSWIYETAFYACPHCGTPHTEDDKWQLVSSGRWVAQAPEVTDRSGFQIDGLTSPWVPWSKVLREFDESRHDRTDLQVFINTTIGIPFAPPSERINLEGLMARAEPMPEFPPWVGALTLGVDLQGDRFELLPVGFGAGERCAIMPPERVFGQIDAADTQRELLAELTKTRSGLRPSAICVDTSYRPEVAWQIVDALNARGIKAYGIKGMEDRPNIITPPSGKSRKGTRSPWTVGTHVVKDSIDARFRAPADGPKGVAFSDQITAEEFAQFTAEEKRLTVVKGRPRKVWRLRPGMRNETLDMFGYAISGLHARGVRFITALATLAEARATVPVAVPDAPSPSPIARPTRPRGSFVNRWR